MHPRDMEHFRDTVAMPTMMRLFENTFIPDGACYIDNLEIHFLDGRSCGHESLIEASGLAYRDGRVEEYRFSECDISVDEFLAAHKDCHFLTDGKLLVSDELEDMELRTRIRSMRGCERLFPLLRTQEEMAVDFGSAEYEKMKHLLNIQQIKSLGHESPSLNDAIDKAREKAAEKNADKKPPSRQDIKGIDR